MIEWAQQILKSNEYTEIRSAPWATIYRFETSQGGVYLKHCIPGLFVEADLIQWIDKKIPGIVPSIIAVNRELGCFLMKDAGLPLRSFLKKKFDLSLLIQALHQFTRIQRTLSEDVDALFAMGLPDFRVERFPALYQSLLQETGLMDEIGLKPEEVKHLSTLSLEPLCQRIASFHVRSTYDQGDFQDNNVLIDPTTRHLTHIDLGEGSVSHPFFALHTFLFMAQFLGYFKPNDPAHTALKNACLENFKADETQENLETLFDLTERLQPLYYVLNLERLVKLCESQGLRDDFINSRGIVVVLRGERRNIPGGLKQLRDAVLLK